MRSFRLLASPRTLRVMLRVGVLAVALVPAACSSCPGCPDSADEAGLPVRVRLHEPVGDAGPKR